MAYDKVIDSAALDADLRSIADAIREKTGSTESLEFPEAFVQAITGIQTEAAEKTATIEISNSNAANVVYYHWGQTSWSSSAGTVKKGETATLTLPVGQVLFLKANKSRSTSATTVDTSFTVTVEGGEYRQAVHSYVSSSYLNYINQVVVLIEEETVRITTT